MHKIIVTFAQIFDDALIIKYKNSLIVGKMKKLTNKEREIMDLYWQYGPMFVRELQEHYHEPRPHFNTLSTIVRMLERKGFLSHKQYGNTYQYFAAITEEEYGKTSMAGVIKSYFDNSYFNVVSSFVKEEKITVEELKELIKQIESNQSK